MAKSKNKEEVTLKKKWATYKKGDKVLVSEWTKEKLKKKDLI